MKSFQFILALGVMVPCGLMAQQPGDDTRAAMQAMIADKMPKIKQASDYIKKASVAEMKKPSMVKLDLAAQMKKIREQCPFLLAQKPLLKLEGERTTTSRVNLQWESINGWNDYSFSVERSFDDTLHFETVNYVWANQQGGIRNEYELPDNNGYKKISYYRLKLVLKDGSFVHSNTARIKGYSFEELKLFPNPAKAIVSLALITDTEGSADIQVFDAMGREISRRTDLILAYGQNNKQLDISSLTPGLYALKILMPDKTERIARFIKQ